MRSPLGDSMSTAVPPSFLSLQTLLARGMTRRQLDQSLRAGRLLRVRNGRYVSGDTPDELVATARLGGRLDCVSLLALLGVFILHKSQLHMQVSIGSSRLPQPSRGVVRHWRETRVERESLCTHVIESLAQAVRCQDPRAALATLDSACHLGIVDEAGLAEVFSLLPRRYLSLRPLVDPRSESGAETLMRLILRTLGCTVDVQVQIPGVGRVDFVVDGWLIIECDSEAHHSGWQAQKRDRRRDLAAAERGYTTIRPIAEDIFHHREQITASLREILAHRSFATAVQNSSTKRRGTPSRTL